MIKKREHQHLKIAGLSIENKTQPEVIMQTPEKKDPSLKRKRSPITVNIHKGQQRQSPSPLDDIPEVDKIIKKFGLNTQIQDPSPLKRLLAS